jgi:hypothetical protein
MAMGGRMHPDAEDSLVQELATMTADDRWIPGHLLIVAGTVLMVGGLWAILTGLVGASRRREVVQQDEQLAELRAS